MNAMPRPARYRARRPLFEPTLAEAIAARPYLTLAGNLERAAADDALPACVRAAAASELACLRGGWALSRVDIGSCYRG